MPLYRVAWKYKAAGACGHGQWMSRREIAEAWAEQGNKDWPDIHHWVQTR
jgi:hypothetical protein